MKKFIVFTTSGFERDVKRLSRSHEEITDILKSVISILEIDPFNVSRKYDIRKLSGVKHGEGQFRIRAGRWRVRYDIEDNKVILYSFRDRKEGY